MLTVMFSLIISKNSSNALPITSSFAFRYAFILSSGLSSKATSMLTYDSKSFVFISENLNSSFLFFDFSFCEVFSHFLPVYFEHYG